MIVRRSGSLEDLNSTENATALLRDVTRGEHINTFYLLDLILHICPSCKYEHLCGMQMLALDLVGMGFDASVVTRQIIISFVIILRWKE